MAAAATASTRDLADQLRRAGLAEVDDSTRRRAEYSTDASLYRVVPQVVAFPRTVDEVIAALGVCRIMGVPLTSRGAGTSIAGNAVGTGLVLDFSRHLTRVAEIDPDASTARIEPGIVLADLQRAAKPYGLRFGPDPSTHNRCTLGGMIGNNACGSRALGYGRTSDNVTDLDVITGTGERLVLGSMAPDFAYAEDGYGLTIHSHAWHAPLWWALPLTLLLAPLVRWAAPTIVAHLPAGGPLAIHDYGVLARVRHRPHVTAISAVIGATTHIVWDAFAHPAVDGRRVIFPALQDQVLPGLPLCLVDSPQINDNSG